MGYHEEFLQLSVGEDIFHLFIWNIAGMQKERCDEMYVAMQNTVKSP